MDWSGWKTALQLWLKTPELIAGTILLLIAVSGLTARLAWKWRDHTATQREANLTDSITDLRGRLHDCREDLRDAKGELRQATSRATDDQQRITREVEELRREVGSLRTTIKDLEKELDRTPTDAEPTRPSVMK